MKKKKGGCFKLIFKLFFTLAVIGLVVLGHPILVDWLDGRQPKEESVEAVQEIPYQEVSVEEQSFAVHYYYGLLSEEEKQVYQEIYQGMLNQEEEIYTHSKDAEAANKILGDVLRDYPDFFWCDGGRSEERRGG